MLAAKLFDFFVVMEILEVGGRLVGGTSKVSILILVRRKCNFRCLLLCFSNATDKASTKAGEEVTTGGLGRVRE